jgi:hypothetical protein
MREWRKKTSVLLTKFKMDKYNDKLTAMFSRLV